MIFARVDFVSRVVSWSSCPRASGWLTRFVLVRHSLCGSEHPKNRFPVVIEVFENPLHIAVGGLYVLRRDRVPLVVQNVVP
jgi:hypothetical protein